METLVTDILKDLGITEKQAMRNFALLNASQKAVEFEQDCEALESKYKMSFKEFEKKLNSQDKEVFEQEDDYLAWKFAVEGYDFWSQRVKQLKNN